MYFRDQNGNALPKENFKVPSKDKTTYPENSVRKNKENKFPTLFIVLIVLVILSSVGGLWWYKNKKQQQQKQEFGFNFY